MTSPAPRKAITLHRIREMHAAGEPITMLTAYDATMAGLVDDCGVDSILVGDSLGMVIQGHGSTVPVTLDQVAYHVQCVARANRNAWLIGDLPYGSYQESIAQAISSSVRLMQAGAQMVKLEGGGWTEPVVRALVERGIPVCAHLGLTPQSVHALGGYRIQGRSEDAVETLLAHARGLADAGAAMMVLELVPSAVGAAVTQAVPIPVIGIGAGSRCSGQVLVLQDMLNLSRGRSPRFVRNFMEGKSSVQEAVTQYIADVKARRFPDDTAHGY